MVTPSFIETYIHLDKSCISDRLSWLPGGLDEAVREVAHLKQVFTPEDVYHRARRTLEKCILNGTTHVRTHLEVDPVIGLRSLEGILPLVQGVRWAVDIEICVFPQEGLLNNPGTDELMVEGLRRGGSVVGAAPYTDSHPKGQIDRVFKIAREFDIDIDMHLDFGPDTQTLDMDYVCDRTERYGYGGRVAIGHVTKLSALPRPAPCPAHPKGLCLDKGYDFAEVRRTLDEFGFTALIRSRGEEAQAIKREAVFKARRWVVERTHSWLNRFRRILIRWDKSPDNYIAFLHFACALIALRAAGLLG